MLIRVKALMMMKRYSDLIRLKSFDERFNYLRLGGGVGYETFGPNRNLNQRFYTSVEWRKFRDYIISRDMGCDLALPGFDISDRPIIHHINPIDVSDIIEHSNALFDPENVILVSHPTHNAIHYGQFNSEPGYVTRQHGDTKLW